MEAKGDGRLRRPQVLRVVTALGLLLPAGSLPAGDCNRNGVPDELDIVPVYRADAAQILPVGRGPVAVTAADLDGDGGVDLVSADRDSLTISVVRNLGGRRFAPAVSFSVGRVPAFVTAADLDGDALLDLVAADAKGTDLILVYQREVGVFEVGGSLDLGESPLSAAAADFDGDGRVDLAAVVRFGVRILRNDGRGGFVDSDRIALGSGPILARAPDLDGDADPDLVTANSLGAAGLSDNVSVLLNLGDGAFSTARNYSTGGRAPAALACEDLDGDGDLDLVTANSESGDVSLFYQRGHATFAAPVILAARTRLASMAVADLSGDGAPEIAAGSLDGDANGNVGLEGSLLVFQQTGGEFALRRTLAVEGGPLLVAAADLDRDGGQDLAVIPHACNSIMPLWNPGGGEFSSPAPRSLYLGVPWSDQTIAADFTGDGHLDLAAAESIRGRVFIVPGTGAGTFAAPIFAALAAGPTLGMTAADVDGDDDLDLVTANNWNLGVSVLRREGGGGFYSAVHYEAGGRSEEIVAADLDGDGDLDVIAANAENGGGLTVLWNDGRGAFADGPRTGVGPCPRSLSAGDIDRDGDVDLAVGTHCDSGNVYLLLNEGNGTFPAARALDGGSSAAAVLLQDFDADGNLDVAASHAGAGVRLHWGTGGGRFAPRIALPGSLDAGPLAAGDVDGDGDLDLAAAVSESNGISVYINRGARAFELAGVFSPWCGASGLITADFDEDGDADLLSGLRGLYAVLVTSGAGPARSRDDNGNRVPDECEGALFHRGDPNGDGRLDLADPTALLDFLFLAAPDPGCREAADADGDAALNLTDILFLLNYLFLDGPPPPAPGPPPAPCGPDVDPPGSPGNLGCESYDRC